jgi:DNA modification methylase
LRDIHEYILIFSKGTYSRELGNKENTITKEKFLEWTKSIWTMNAESARKVGHPAPFPEELPNRLIQLYSFKGDVILDPFMGSGTTGLAALKCGRIFVGYDISEDYIKLANNRINAFKNQTVFTFHSPIEKQVKVTAPNSGSNDTPSVDKPKINLG